jgi:tRNA(Ser,Leu) C12 N-acetylase TAN1
MTTAPETDVRPEPEQEGVDQANLLVSILWRAPGRARKEIIRLLRALHDTSPLVMPTGRRGLMAVRTSLDPRAVVRGLRELAATNPQGFRATCKWVPVDLWTAGDLETMRRGVAQLQTRIAPTERWRMTVEKRAEGTMSTPALIAALAALVPARVDLTHPDKVLMVQLFSGRAALSVLAPTDVFSMVPLPWLAPARPPATAGPDTGAARAGLPAMPETLVQRVAGAAGDSARPLSRDRR